jgi:hypothetical protein
MLSLVLELTLQMEGADIEKAQVLLEAMPEMAAMALTPFIGTAAEAVVPQVTEAMHKMTVRIQMLMGAQALVADT